MKDLVLTVRVLEASLRETGDDAGPVGENVINVLLLCPRPGKAEALGSVSAMLRDHVRPETPPDRPASLGPLLLKESVEGEVSLLVHVLERDPQRRFARFLRRLALGAAAGTGGHVFGGIARHAFNGALDSGVLELGDGGNENADERLEVIAVSERPVTLTAARLAEIAGTGPVQVVVAMQAPRDLARPREKGTLAPLRPNGSLTLEIGAFA